MDWKVVNYKGIKVFYLPQLHGGGMDFGQDYLPVVGELFSKVDYLCEFACGPGFIGFSLLSNGLSRKLCLIDVNPLAIECCNKTIRENRLKKVVKTYVSDVLDGVPKTEKWDLVVGNPPFFNGTRAMYKKDIIGIDPGWVIHKKFYRDVPGHLADGGSVLFIESLVGSSPGTWRTMISKNGLIFKKAFGKKMDIFAIVKRIIRIALALRLSDVKKEQIRQRY